jgi:hypothetical protein
VTDDATTPTPAADGPAAAPTTPIAAAEDQPDPARRRRRRLIGVGIAGAAVLILVVCAGAGALAAGFGRMAREADGNREGHARADTACLDLERRLNRLVPPGAATNPGQRAAAIRDENAAVRPFLAEIEQLRGRWHDDEGDDDGGAGRGGWADGWRQLVDARAAFADALDQQVTSATPAFFLAPQDRRGRPVIEQVQRGPESCAGPVRRLAAPDL